MAILKATKKPVTIECIQLTEKSAAEVLDFITGPFAPQLVWHHPDGGFSNYRQDGDTIGIQINTLEGPMVGKQGDYIIKGVAGEFYACDEAIFYKTYDIEDEDIITTFVPEDEVEKAPATKKATKTKTK